MLKRDEHPSTAEILSKKQKQSSHVITVPVYDEVSNSRSPDKTITLNIDDYEKWDYKQVVSVLMADRDNGGGNLLVEKVKPFIDSKFDGTALYSIVDEIKKGKEDSNILQVLQTMFHFGGIIMDSQLTIACIRIINWAKDNLIKVNTTYN